MSDGNRLEPPGDCEEEEYERLRVQVRRQCKKNPVGCSERHGCRELRKRRTRARKCAEARERINRKCFRGGDPEHRRQARLYRRALRKCTEIFNAKC